MRQNTSAANPPSGSATAAGSLIRLDLGSSRRLRLATAKLERQRARGSLGLLMQAKLQEMRRAKSQAAPRALLSANCRAKVKLLVQQPATFQLLVPQDRLPRQVTEIPLARVRAGQCLRGPGPSAFFRGKPEDR